MKSNLLEVENLGVRYGGIHALKGVSFSIRSGEIVSLVGSNGAGKTTTLRGISGLLSSSGSLRFAGSSGSLREIASLPAHERVKLGLAHCPEGRGIFPNLTVLENLQLGAYIRRDKEVGADLEKCFSLFPRLRERSTQPAGTLSGGEQQMVAISRAMMSRPTLLMLDEPSLGLAPLIVAQIFQIIQQLNRDGMSILLVEQNARMALSVSDRAYVLETGQISLSGTGRELMTDPRVMESYLGGH